MLNLIPEMSSILKASTHTHTQVDQQIGNTVMKAKFLTGHYY